MSEIDVAPAGGRNSVEVAMPADPSRRISAWALSALLLWCAAAREAPLRGAETTYLDGHDGVVREVAVSPDGKWLVSVGDDGRIVVRPVTDLAQAQTHQPRDGGLMCMAFTRDSRRVYAAGNLGDFSRTTEIDGAIRVSLTEGQVDGFVEFPVQGTIKRMTLVNDDSRFMYFCASQELLSLDIGASEFASNTPVKGGFTGVTAISPGARHFAITSQNERNDQSAEPCWLSVFNQEGQLTLNYEFADEREYHGSQACFVGDERLVLCIPTGKLLRWSWSRDRDRWEQQGEPLTMTAGQFGAAVSDPDRGVIWVGRDRVLAAIDIETGAVRQETMLEIGPRPRRRVSAPVACAAVMPASKLVVAGLQDGRLAVSPIADTGN